jgi:hypothetical protein
MNYYFECIYEVLQRSTPTDSTLPTLNRLKAKLVRLQGMRLQKLLLDTNETDRIDGEKPTLYNVLQMTKRKEERTIYSLRDAAGEVQTSPSGIARTMTSYLREKYDKIEVDAHSIQKLVDVLNTPSQKLYAEELVQPFGKDEIYQAFRAGGQRKAPGVDGIGRAFYLRTWDVIQADMVDIFNQMFWSGNITPQQKHGVVICLPKGQNSCTPRDYRPITLLNEDYKCLARMVTRRLKPLLTEHLTGLQYCGVPGTSILDAVATIRDTIAHAEHKRILMCVFSFDFSNAFDKVPYDYLFQILAGYGIEASFLTGIHSMYAGATSSVQINGHSQGPIPSEVQFDKGAPRLWRYMPYACIRYSS